MFGDLDLPAAQIGLRWGGHSDSRPLPRALQAPARAEASFVHAAVTGDVLGWSSWEDWRSNNVGGGLYVASRVPVFMKTHLPRAPE